MISLSAILADVDGHVIIHESLESTRNSNTARATITPALNGKVVLVHSGAFKVDKPFRIKGSITRAQETILWNLFYNYNTMLMTSGVECYLVTIQHLNVENGNLNMVLIVSNNELE